MGRSDEPLVTAYDCAMLDLDGVVYVGPHAVDGVPALLERARGAGMALAYVTNNASRPAPMVAAHLRDLGVPAQDADVVTSAQAAAREIEERLGAGTRVLVIGGDGLEWALKERGLEPVRSREYEPAAVAQGFHPDVGWRQLAEGAAAIREGALWVASNLDRTFPTPDGPAPGNGALVGAVTAAVGREPDVVAGKPFRPLFDETVRRVGAQRPLVVGDRLDTDIEGAVRAEADSLLVLTGVTDVATLLAAVPGSRPTYVAWTLEALFTSHEAPEHVDGCWRLGDWEARVHEADGGATVLVTRGESGSAAASAAGQGAETAGSRSDRGAGSRTREADIRLRVAVAAAWAWQDDHGEPVRRVEGLQSDG